VIQTRLRTLAGLPLARPRRCHALAPSPRQNATVAASVAPNDSKMVVKGRTVVLGVGG